MAKSDGVIKGVYSQFKGLFDSSTQGMYIYLDDKHKVCNENFASMLGYASAKEWASVKENFPSVFVAQKDRHKVVSAFHNAMVNGAGVAGRVEWKKKSKGTVRTNVILVPIAYKGQMMALHFIEKA